MDTFFISKLDFDKLNKEIDKYVNENQQKPYIFMHNDTAKALMNVLETKRSDAKLLLLEKLNAELNGIAGYYNDCKIFKNNALEYGEVEIK